MPNRIMRASLLLTSCMLLAAASALAQEKATPKTMERSTSSDAAKAAFAAALEEVENIGGAHRVDDKLKAALEADANFALGRAFYGGWAGGLTAAERNAELTRAVKDAANSSTAELVFITAIREWRAGRNPVARDLADVAIKLAPDDPTVTWFRVLVAANAADALAVAEPALKRFPDYPPLLNLTAYRLNTVGRTDEALAMVQKYVTVLPKHPNAHDSFAELLQLNKRYDEAATHYGHALAADPKYEVAHEGLAEIAVARGQYDAARAHLAQSMGIAATPARRVALRRELATTYMHEGKLKEAKATLASVITEAEASSVSALGDHRALAFILALEGNAAEAERHYKAATPPTPPATQPLADALFHAVLKHPAAVNDAAAAMEANAANAPNTNDTQQAMWAARVIRAVANNDLNAARAARQQITLPLYKALSGAFLGPVAAKAQDSVTAQAALADVKAFNNLTLNAGVAHILVKRK